MDGTNTDRVPLRDPFAFQHPHGASSCVVTRVPKARDSARVTRIRIKRFSRKQKRRYDNEPVVETSNSSETRFRQVPREEGEKSLARHRGSTARC